jgi:hypothetical protein
MDLDLNYNVVQRQLLGDLNVAVSKLRERGWECVGGVTFVNGMYLQAMQRALK